MNKYKTLIILDWDDTLFPTTWLLKNNINLANSNMLFFSKLDDLLVKLFKKIVKYGQIAIVTNASIKWVQTSSNILPNTKKMINQKILLISAREGYQDKYPSRMELWKKLIFKDLVNKHFSGHVLQNIISIGDADYEFYALTDLFDNNSVTNKRVLKTVRLMKDPTFENLLDQIAVLNDSIEKLLFANKHMDLLFTPHV